MQSGREEAAERDVHSLHGVRKREEVRALLRRSLEDGPSREPVARLPCELVEQVPDPDVEGLTEDSIAATREPDHLRVPPAHVQEDRVFAPAHGPSDLEV